MKLYNVYYIDDEYGVEPRYECTTDNFKKWLKEHNKKRVADGFKKEKADYFIEQDVELILFDKK